MTPEEFERAIEYILKLQAQFEIDAQNGQAERLQAERELREMLSRLGKTIEDQQRAFEDRQRAFEDHQQRAFEDHQRAFEGRQQVFEGRQQIFEDRQQVFEDRQQIFEDRQRVLLDTMIEIGEGHLALVQAMKGHEDTQQTLLNVHSSLIELNRQSAGRLTLVEQSIGLMAQMLERHESRLDRHSDRLDRRGES